MALDIPSTSKDEVLQDRFNRQVDEAISRLNGVYTSLELRVTALENAVGTPYSNPNSLDTRVTTLEP